MKRSISKVYPEYVHEKIQAGLAVHLIDVRSSQEYQAEHADGARLMPMTELSADVIKSQLNEKAGVSEPIYLICTAGLRAEKAAEQLHSQGMTNLYVVNGGTDAWKSLDLPMVYQPKKRWLPALSPQSQAQLFMGLVLMILALKGLLLHPAFIMAVFAVGLALMLASLNQRFCIARLFEDLPWNKA